MGFRIRSSSLIMLATVCVIATLASTSEAAFSGDNGKIAFVQVDATNHPYWNADIATIQPDGSRLANLTASPDFDEVSPAWSPDGTKIAFSSPVDGDFEVYVMSADGTGVKQLTHNELAADEDPTWSPDGRKIAFVGYGRTIIPTEWGSREYATELLTMNADGSDQTSIRLSINGTGTQPAWSPDGKKIAFMNGDGIATINPDGTGETVSAPAIPEGGDNGNPSWSPDGRKLAYYRRLPIECWCGHTNIVTLDLETGVETRITRDAFAATQPAWSPDGTMLAFNENNYLYEEIHIVNADGTNEHVLPGPRRPYTSADWQPIPNDPGRFKNAVEFCDTQRRALGRSGFTERYGGHRNAFGRCVSAAS
jgi:TolB protein